MRRSPRLWFPGPGRPSPRCEDAWISPEPVSRPRSLLPLALIIVLIVALGSIALRSSRSARDAAETAHRQDAVLLENTLARLANEFLLVAGKELLDFATLDPFSLVPGDPADRARLETFVSRSPVYNYGAALTGGSLEPLNTWAEGPLPIATDPGYDTLKAGVLTGNPGVSSVMRVEGVPLVAVAIPALIDPSGVVLFIGYWRADTSLLQQYSEEIRQEPNAQAMVVDSRGVVVATRSPAVVGRDLGDHPALTALAAGREGVLEFDRDGTSMTAIYSPVGLGDWNLVKEVPTSEFLGAIRRTHERTDTFLVALLVAAAVSVLALVHRVQRTRSRAEQRFRALVNNAADVITVVAADGSISYDSPAVERVLGYAEGERAGKHVTSYVHPDNADCVASAIAPPAADSGSRVGGEIQVRRRDGRYRWFDITMTNLVHDPVVRGIVLNQHDVTERKVAEDAARERGAQLAEAQSLAHIGSWSWDISSDVVEWSDELYRLFGLEPQSVRMSYARFLEHVHPEDRPRVEETVMRAYETGQPFSVDHRLVRPEGPVVWLHGRGEVVMRDGRPERMFGTAMDVTDRKRVEDELRALDAAKNEFIANAAHELRTPLTVLVGFTSVLSAQPPRENVNEFLVIFKENAKRIETLINNLLDLSQIEHGTLELDLRAANLTSAVRFALDTAPPASGVSVAVDVPRELAAVADTTRLSQVLLNLLTNAYKYGGSEVLIEAVGMGEHVVLSVSDNGDGVPDDVIGRLFEPFARGSNVTRARGSGLGLSIVRKLVEGFGGDVWYEDRDPHGARFVIRLAAAAAHQPGVVTEARSLAG